MNITGLTGHSGSGKTTVSEILRSKGFYHINCDKIVHEKIYTDPDVLKQIADTFGEKFVCNNTLNRKSFSKLIFSNKDCYDKLMILLYPFIIKYLQAEISASNKQFILLDAPTLFEFGLDSICDQTIAVISNKAVERICKRDGITVEEAELRLNNQKSHSFYIEHCDYLIQNDFDISTLEKSANNIADEIMEKKHEN